MLRGTMNLAFALAALLRASSALACPGDCNTDGHVTVDELVLGVLAIEGSSARCPSFDVDGGGVSLAEVKSASESALTGCPFLGEFHSTVILDDGKSGALSMTVGSDGSADATLTISDGGTGAGGGAAAPTVISLSGSVDLATGVFTLRGSFDDGQGHVVDVFIEGTLPRPLAGAGTVDFQIGPDPYESSILPGSPPTSTPTPDPTPTATPKGTVHVIRVDDAGPGESVFQPEFLAIDVGDTVEWQFVGGSHSAVSSAFDNQGLPSCNPDGAYDSGVKSSGTFRHTFDVAGDFAYHCGVAGHCVNFESGLIQVIGPTPPTPTATPTPTRTPTTTATPATIDGVSVDMLGTYAGTATSQSTGFMQPIHIRIDAGTGMVTATDLDGTLFFFGSVIVMNVIDPTHLSYNGAGPPEVSVTLDLTGPGHVDGVFKVIIPFMPSTPVLLSLNRQP